MDVSHFLKNELVERILYEIYTAPDSGTVPWTRSDVARSLAACCLVCKSWNPRSRFFLYRKIEIGTKGQVAALTRSRYSTSQSGIATAVFSFTDKLDHLHTLILRSFSLQDVHPDWFAGLSNLKSVQSLELHRTEDVSLNASLRLLTLFPNLKELVYDPAPWKLVAKGWELKTSAKKPAAPSVYDKRMRGLCLTSLAVRLGAHNLHEFLLRLMQRPYTLSKLQRIVLEGWTILLRSQLIYRREQIPASEPANETVLRLLKRCQGTVRDMEISFDMYARPSKEDTPGFDLERYPLLESLTFNNTAAQWTLPWVVHLLSSVSSPRIARILIEFKSFPIDTPFLSLDKTATHDWSALDSALTAPNLRSVQVVQVSIQRTSMPRRSYDEPAKFWQSKLPLTMSRGLLQVCYGYRDFTPYIESRSRR
ncbi:hypothetical protein K474DRAFT_764026 [Panus rudis PR-1116 ss-1]|nr:hypothetical protein K474DRAFT_764026 [Panus rudis PR-1116 ss-1]